MGGKCPPKKQIGASPPPSPPFVWNISLSEIKHVGPILPPYQETLPLLCPSQSFSSAITAHKRGSWRTLLSTDDVVQRAKMERRHLPNHSLEWVGMPSTTCAIGSSKLFYVQRNREEKIIATLAEESSFGSSPPLIQVTCLKKKTPFCSTCHLYIPKQNWALKASIIFVSSTVSSTTYLIWASFLLQRKQNPVFIVRTCEIIALFRH